MAKSVQTAVKLDLHDRAGRLTRIVAAADVAADFPLLKVVRIGEADFARL